MKLLFAVSIHRTNPSRVLTLLQRMASPAHSQKDANGTIAVKLSNGLAEAVTISKPAQQPKKGETTTVTEKFEFKCSAGDAFAVFMDPGRVQAWTQSPVKVCCFRANDCTGCHGIELSSHLLSESLAVA
jgi:activator of HSP90 ATPase